MEYLWRCFLCRTETLYNYCCTYHKVPWYVHCGISMATQWDPGPLHSKGKIRVFLLQEVLFPLDVHSIGLSEYGHYTAQTQDSGATKVIRHFSFWEGRGLVTSVLLWWHNCYHNMWLLQHINSANFQPCRRSFCTDVPCCDFTSSCVQLDTSQVLLFA